MGNDFEEHKRNLFSIQKVITSTYCKNFDVLFAALWTKLSILSQNRGNLKKIKIMLPDNVDIATLTSLLPR
jgi:hypothetical protein